MGGIWTGGRGPTATMIPLAGEIRGRMGGRRGGRMGDVREGDNVGGVKDKDDEAVIRERERRKWVSTMRVSRRQRRE